MKVYRIRNLAGALGLALALYAAPARADDVAFNHVTIVDVVGGRLVPDQMVRISGQGIVQVAPASRARKRKGIASSTRPASS